MNQDFDGDVIDSPGTAIREAASAGLPVQKVGNQFATAIAVQRPRVLVQIERRVIDEARLLGAAGYYGWGAAGDKIEGLSIEMASMIARNWGNCVVDVAPVQDGGDSWIFTSVFIDLETGFNMARQFRQSKRWVVHGRHDEERKSDIRFQIGQSKSARNVILRSLPQWLLDKALDAAKEGVMQKLEAAIAKGGIESVRQSVVQAVCKHGCKPEQVAAKFGRANASGLTKEDLIVAKGDLIQLNDGAETVRTLGYVLDEQTIPRGTEGLKTVLGTDAPAKPAEDPPKRKVGRPRTVQAPTEPAAQETPTDDRESLLKRVRSAYISLAAQKREAVASQYENALALSELAEWSTDDLRDLERKILEA